MLFVLSSLEDPDAKKIKNENEQVRTTEKMVVNPVKLFTAFLSTLGFCIFVTQFRSSKMFYIRQKTSKIEWPSKIKIPFIKLTRRPKLTRSRVRSAARTATKHNTTECFTSLWRNFFFVELFQFSHTGGFFSMKGLFKVKLKHLNPMEVQIWTRPLQNLVFSFSHVFVT